MRISDWRSDVCASDLLRGAELDLRLQHQRGMGMGIEQAALQRIAFKRIAVLPDLDLTASAQQGQVAQDGGVIPAEVLALEALKKALDRGAHAAPGIALDDGQRFQSDRPSCRER